MIWMFPYCIVSFLKLFFQTDFSWSSFTLSHLCIPILEVKPWLHWSPPEIQLEITMAVLLLFISNLHYKLFNDGKLSPGIYSHIVLIFKICMRTGKGSCIFLSVHPVLGTSATILTDLRHDFYFSVFVNSKNHVNTAGNYIG